MDRSKLRKLIKCLMTRMGVSGCFFWYRRTWVVPDKRPLNSCECVCVCYFANYHGTKSCYTWLLYFTYFTTVTTDNNTPPHTAMLFLQLYLTFVKCMKSGEDITNKSPRQDLGELLLSRRHYY